MTQKELYQAFQQRFPLEKLQFMPLDEYTTSATSLYLSG